jgi:Flp pilus assembly secretin CpaC
MRTYRGCGLMPVLLIAAGLLLAGIGPLSAAESGPLRESLTINAGEQQVINNLDPNSKPIIKVIDNPHALVVHSEQPSKLFLLGAERGKWDITVIRDDGKEVIYAVTVNAIVDPNNRLKPGTVAGETVASASESGSATGASKTAPAASPSFEAVPARDGAAGAPVGAIAAAPPASAPLASAGEAGVMTSQAASAAAQARPSTFRNDPGLIKSGGMYSTQGVASSGGTHYLPAGGISLMTGMSQVIDFQRRLRRVAIADTKIADIQVVNPFQLDLIAHKPGFTTLTVWTDQGHYQERQVRIDPSGKQQVMLNCIVAELDRNKLENQGMNMAAALSNAGVSLVSLPGAVATPFSPQSQVTGQSALGTVTSTSSASMGQGGTLTPLLLSQNLTYGLATQNGQLLQQTFFQYLENHDLGKVLAEPHLLANSGEKAKFLSGGEIPIVISQALNTSIVFKQFGTSVVFLPTVVGTNDIELLVQPEVSQPDYTHGVQMFGFTVPAFVTRKASTMVRLRDDQTLIIAGLILHQKQETIQKVPYLGDIPLMGGLFRNTSWQDQETDLVMSVTPQIVRPLPTGGQVYMPTRVGPLTSREIATRRLSTPDAARPRF